MADETPEIRTPERALVIFAHPDDAELGSAGTVAVWSKAGAEVWTCIVTDASGGGPDDAEDVGPEARRAISETRKAEQRAACEVLGQAGAVFLDYPDGRIEPNLELRRDIVRLIRRLRPEIIITHSPDRRWDEFFAFRHHPDHLAVGTAVTAAVYPAARNAWDFPELLDEGLLPHKVREIYIMGAPEQNYASDISATFDLKVAALAAHASQVGPRMADLEPRLRQWATELGTQYGFAYAEVFHKTENG
jgi:LmbE family N-acetylglucosaminyl deacetylase